MSVPKNNSAWSSRRYKCDAIGTMTDMPRPQLQHRARKRFGQNFLHDATVIDRIAAAVQPRPEQHLVEIGPGQGALTALLLYLFPSLVVVVSWLAFKEPPGRAGIIALALATGGIALAVLK